MTTEEMLVTVRPPANEAHYHNPESEAFVRGSPEVSRGNAELRMVLLPRNKSQEANIRRSWPSLFQLRQINRAGARCRRNEPDLALGLRDQRRRER